MSGTLYIVGTPIGNLGDITLRAIETLREADIVAAEDTRHTAKLLSHLDIHKRLISFHEHSGRARVDELTALLEEGNNIALVSDAGMPMISDPGYQLTRACIDESIPVAVVPGPSAVTAAIALSGIDCRRFIFGGFLSAKQVQRRQELVQLSSADAPIVVYESPNRMIELLEDVCEVLDNQVQVCAAKEITKIYEEALRGTAGEVLRALREQPQIRGEYVVIINAHLDVQEMEDEQLREQLTKFMAEGMSKRDAARYASVVFNLPKKRAYKLLLDMEENR